MSDPPSEACRERQCQQRRGDRLGVASVPVAPTCTKKHCLSVCLIHLFSLICYPFSLLHRLTCIHIRSTPFIASTTSSQTDSQYHRCTCTSLIDYARLVSFHACLPCQGYVHCCRVPRVLVLVSLSSVIQSPSLLPIQE